MTNTTNDIDQHTPAAAKTRHRNAGLDQVLTRHWTDTTTALVIAPEPPADPSTLSASARFADAVTAAAPNWVMLPIPPQSRDAAKRHVNALKRRGLDAVMRPSPDNTRAWAIWATARVTPATTTRPARERATTRPTSDRATGLDTIRDSNRDTGFTREAS
jgi:hypothetical protein